MVDQVIEALEAQDNSIDGKPSIITVGKDKYSENTLKQLSINKFQLNSLCFILKNYKSNLKDIVVDKLCNFNNLKFGLDAFLKRDVVKTGYMIRTSWRSCANIRAVLPYSYELLKRNQIRNFDILKVSYCSFGVDIHLPYMLRMYSTAYRSDNSKDERSKIFRDITFQYVPVLGFSDIQYIPLSCNAHFIFSCGMVHRFDLVAEVYYGLGFSYENIDVILNYFESISIISLNQFNLLNMILEITNYTCECMFYKYYQSQLILHQIIGLLFKSILLPSSQNRFSISIAPTLCYFDY